VWSSLEEVVRTVVEGVKRRHPYARVSVHYMNFARHALIAVEHGDTVRRIYVVFVRAPFYRFCDYFPRWCEEHGRDHALTLNWEVMVRLSDIGITRVYYFLEDGRVYMVPLKLFYDLKLCRYQKKERATRVCHVPLKMARLVADYSKGIPLDIYT